MIEQTRIEEEDGMCDGGPDCCCYCEECGFYLEECECDDPSWDDLTAPLTPEPRT